MSVYYKFKTQKNWDAISFDNAVISVLDLKRAIVRQKKLDKNSDDFDLLLTNSQTGELYRDDAFLIPKNTSVEVKRIPASKQRALVIKAAPQIAITDNPVESASTASAAGTIGGVSGEHERMMDVVRQASQLSGSGVPTPGVIDAASLAKGKRGAQFQQRVMTAGGKPPPGYICHRCKKPGHFIQNCPTNGDQTFDFKRSYPPTGIPRSFLRASQVSDPSQGAMAIGDGKYVVVQPNEVAFENALSTQRTAAEIAAAALSQREKEEIPQNYACFVCRGWLKNAIVLPCCNAQFCEECLRQRVTVSSTECPRCHSPLEDENFKVQTRLQTIVDEEREKWFAERERKLQEQMKEESPSRASPSMYSGDQGSARPPASEDTVHCGRCGNPGHLSRDCPTHAPPPRPAPRPSRRGPPQGYPPFPAPYPFPPMGYPSMPPPTEDHRDRDRRRHSRSRSHSRDRDRDRQSKSRRSRSRSRTRRSSRDERRRSRSRSRDRDHRSSRDRDRASKDRERSSRDHDKDRSSRDRDRERSSRDHDRDRSRRREEEHRSSKSSSRSERDPDRKDKESRRERDSSRK